MDLAQEFFRKLQDRKIGHTFIVYIGSSWVVLEALSFFIQRYNMDNRILDIFLILLLFGLPTAIIMRWYHSEEPARSIKKKEIFIHLCILMAALFTISLFLQRTEATVRKKEVTDKSIAVLPFENLSKNPEDEYFSDGVMEDIISRLYKISGLVVTSRTSALMYRNTTKSVQDIGRELGVSYLVEGSVRQSGQKVRITARLINASNDQNIWTDTYDQELKDVFKVQSDVAEQIAHALEIKLSSDEKKQISKAPTSNTLAYQYCQRGKYFNTQGTDLESIQKSRSFYLKAIEEDPNYAEAYAGLAEVYISTIDWGYISPNDASPLIKQYLQKALAIDSTLGEAYSALGSYYFYYQHDFGEAEKAFEKSLALNPGLDFTYLHYSNLASSAGMHEKALDLNEKYIRVNPLSPKPYGFKVRFLYLSRDFKASEMEARRALTIFPGDDFILWCQASTLTKLGRYQEAIDIFLKRSVGSKANNWALAYAYAKAGQPDKARKILDYILMKSQTSYVPPILIAMIYGSLGEHDNAFKFLEKGIEVNDYWLVYLGVEPMADDLRDDPRFKETMQRANFNKKIIAVKLVDF